MVFLTGLEEHIFPHARSIAAEEMGDDAAIEEERRLMYVAMTRAQDKLFLSNAKQRFLHGQSRYQMPSRFLEEIEEHLPDFEAPQDVFSNWSLQRDEPQIPVYLKAGDTVSHAQFGQGRVERVYGDRNHIAVIAFASKGKRVLDTTLAPLEKV